MLRKYPPPPKLSHLTLSQVEGGGPKLNPKFQSFPKQNTSKLSLVFICLDPLYKALKDYSIYSNDKRTPLPTSFLPTNSLVYASTFQERSCNRGRMRCSLSEEWRVQNFSFWERNQSLHSGSGWCMGNTVHVRRLSQGGYESLYFSGR